MTENDLPQDNPSMEDILSSIKGILSEDEQQNESSVSPQPNTPEEEVFDLSASMIFDRDSPQNEEISASLTENVEDDLPELSIETTEEKSSDRVSAPLDENFNFSEELTTLQDQDTAAGKAEDLTTGKAEDKDAISEEQLDKLIQSIDDNNVDSVLEREIPEAEPKHEEKTEEEKPEEVSDSIISNFAQMFSENNKETAVGIAPVSTTMKIGEGAQTVEELIKAVMAESLKPAIEKAITSVDKDIMEIAKEQVAKGAKIWVDKNLTEVVESVIREEVKRVMAKVGS